MMYTVTDKDSIRRYLLALRDGIDAEDIHCEPVPISSSWRYMVDKALEVLDHK